MKIKNFLLAISVVAFAVGFSDLQENIVFWMGRPIGALALGLYFVFTMLEKETALLDEQEQAKNAALKNGQASPRLKQTTTKNETGALRLASS